MSRGSRATTRQGQWLALKPGDIVDVIAPGFACTEQELQDGLQYLKNLGLKPRVAPDLFGVDLICSQTDKLRLKHLKTALYCRESKAVWCLRGGYGALRLLPEVRKWKRPAKSKLFVGYSDVTSLHDHFNRKWQWSTLHGPLLDRLGSGRASGVELSELENLIFGRSRSQTFRGLFPLNKAATRRLAFKAPVIGGNMSVLASAIGTPSALKARGKILFLEDWGERAYRIDRMLQQFEQSRAFEGLKALVLGDFIGGADKDGIVRVWDLWKEYAQRCKFPILSGIQSGHGEVQRPLPLGVKAELSLGQKPQLELPAGVR